MELSTAQRLSRSIQTGAEQISRRQCPIVDMISPECGDVIIRSAAKTLKWFTVSVESHFEKSAPEVLATYRRLLEAARALGPVVEESKKTTIHLVSRTAFAGVATRRSSLILTLKSAKDIRSPRVEKRERTSAHRWHVDIRLTRPADVDRQLTNWLSAAYMLAGGRHT
jgi:hypothetical protein